MDVFKQNRYLNLVVILLVVLNLATLTMLWLGRPEHPAPGLHRPEQAQKQIEQTLRTELGFDDAQIEAYLRLRRTLRERVRRLDGEIRQTKKQMFDAVLEKEPQRELSDSLLTLAQEKQAQIERLTYQYFLDLKKICTEEQQERLKQRMFQLFQKRPDGVPQVPRQPPPPDENQ